MRVRRRRSAAAVALVAGTVLGCGVSRPVGADAARSVPSAARTSVEELRPLAWAVTDASRVDERVEDSTFQLDAAGRRRLFLAFRVPDLPARATVALELRRAGLRGADRGRVELEVARVEVFDADVVTERSAPARTSEVPTRASFDGTVAVVRVDVSAYVRRARSVGAGTVAFEVVRRDGTGDAIELAGGDAIFGPYRPRLVVDLP